VTVNVQHPVYDAGVSPAYEGEDWIVVDLDPGKHKLDGRLALGYVRTRWATSDYDRMQRQRCLVGDLLQQATLPKILRSFPKLASAMKKYVTTDVPRDALPDLVELLTSIDSKQVVGVNFVPPRFSSYAHVDEMRAAVQSALRHGPSADAGVDLLKGSCS
jgi:anionic cell wall polymer biosynthesis LytR-Cps2A-Psr (LCP) family protein